jgi:hypothetical protein
MNRVAGRVAVPDAPRLVPLEIFRAFDKLPADPMFDFMVQEVRALSLAEDVVARYGVSTDVPA